MPRKIRATGPKVCTEGLRVNVDDALSFTHGMPGESVADWGAEVRPGLNVSRIPNWGSWMGRGSGQSKPLGVDIRWGSG